MTLFFLFQSRCTCPETSPRQNKFWLLNCNETVDHGSSLLLPKEEYCPGPDIEVIRRSDDWSKKGYAIINKLPERYRKSSENRSKIAQNLTKNRPKIAPSCLLLPKKEYCSGPDIEVIRRSEDWSTKKWYVFCYQNCSDLLWEKIVLVIE